MADYASILNKAISGLQENNTATRASIYGKARAAIERQLRAMTPAPSQEAIDRQLQMLEAAISGVEAEQAAAEALSIPDPAREPVQEEVPAAPADEAAVPAHEPAPEPPAPSPPPPVSTMPEPAVPPAYEPPPPPAPPVAEPPQPAPRQADTVYEEPVAEEAPDASARDSLPELVEEPLAPVAMPGIPAGHEPPHPAEPLKGPVEDIQASQTAAPEISEAPVAPPAEPSVEPAPGPAETSEASAGSDDDSFNELADAIDAAAGGWEPVEAPQMPLPDEPPHVAEPVKGEAVKGTVEDIAGNAPPALPGEQEFTADSFADAFERLAGEREDALNAGASNFEADGPVDVPEPVFNPAPAPAPSAAPARPPEPVSVPVPSPAGVGPAGQPHPAPRPAAAGVPGGTGMPNQGMAEQQAYRPEMPPSGAMPGGPAVPPAGPGVANAPGASAPPPYLQEKPKRGGAGKFVAGAVILALLGGGAYAGWMNREKITELVQGLTGGSGEQVATTQEPAPAETPAEEKSTDRLGAGDGAPAPDADAPMEPENSMPDGQQSGMEEKSVGQMGTETPQDSQPDVTAEPAPDAVTAEPDATTEEPPVLEEVTPDSADSGDAQDNGGATTADNQAVAPASGQTAYLYEEGGGDGGASRDEARVTWTLAERAPEDGMPPEPVIKGSLDVPGRGLNLDIVIRRNVDPALSASHIIELNFNVLPEFSGGGIDDVSRFVMKANESARGQSLVGVPVKIDNGYFLIALNNLEQAKQANETLMESSDWIDIPIRYVSGRRALLALEKGTSGKEVFDKALADWKNR